MVFLLKIKFESIKLDYALLLVLILLEGLRGEWVILSMIQAAKYQCDMYLIGASLVILNIFYLNIFTAF